LWDWHHVFIGSDESDDFLIDVSVTNILGGSLGEGVGAWWSVSPSVNWISGFLSGKWDWNGVLVGSDESNNFLINVFV
jgi:hypothetical protein